MEEHEKKVIAEEKHKEWIQKKNQQERKREQKINKEMEENVAEELEKEHLQEKSKEKYQEWLKKKMLKNVIRKGKKQLQGELQGKKEIAGKKFKEWLENSNNKPCLAAESYGYANGKHRILQWKF